MNTHTATAYLVLKAKRQTYGRANSETGLREVDAVKIVDLRQSRPKTLDPDEVVVKVRVQIPDVTFDPIMPSALVIVHTDLAIRGPIEVTVDDANDGDER